MEKALSSAPFSSNFLEIINLKYKMVIHMINRLNSIAEYFLDDEGNQLKFEIKPGTDQTFLWKLTIRILATRVSQAQRLADFSNSFHLFISLVSIRQVQARRTRAKVVSCASSE